MLVDGWFNSQKRKTADGRSISFHCAFQDDANSGYSFCGRCSSSTMHTETLAHAPRAEDLKGVAISMFCRRRIFRR